ncbi:MAG: hypothetical protein KBA53_12075 [Thermoclostridium sp.]|nr:hypothetical protein [Thermoclostridium sp.]
MSTPDMRYFFVSQSPDMMVSPQSQELPQQNMHQVSPMSQYNPMQVPYEMNEGNYTDSMDASMYWQTDPPPVLSNNPATASIRLFKELTAYPNYGNPSRNADILYTGTQGSWTFESPAFLFVPGNLRAQMIIRAVLDDHANVPVNGYSARITINGNVVHNGRLALQHGVPAGGIFTNWTELTFNITNLRRVTRVTIENTSTAGTNDWIALDWMYIRLVPRM